jgi:hypothetical protein
VGRGWIEWNREENDEYGIMEDADRGRSERIHTDEYSRCIEKMKREHG